jgi:xanthine dehydrogenase accessory factor
MRPVAPDGDALTTAESWLRAGRNVAIATVMETWGSAPRPVGSHLVIDGAGNFEGSVSGGCVEGAVIREALDLMGRSSGRLVEYGVADEKAWQVGLSCGGRIKVHVAEVGGKAAMDLATLARLNAEREARRRAATITDLATGEVRLFTEADVGNAQLDGTVARAFQTGTSGFVPGPAGEPLFLSVYLPPPRLVLIGAVHISQALAPMAHIAGFDVTIIDPRTAFATPERFGDVKVKAEWPDKAILSDPLDQFTAVAALTHDPKIDDDALVAGLRAGCFYVGALGSRKTHAKRVARLRAAGLVDETIARIHAPIGLAISAQSPGEIAVAVLAEVIAALRGKAAPPGPDA